MSLLQLLSWCIIFGRLMADEKFTLDIPQGSLQGLKTTTSYHGVPVFSFRGIPYAKPNIGRDKFRLSQPADNWSGVLDATKFKSTCVFYCMLKQEIIGDDDCLYLNVYSPDPRNDAKKPVIVYIHGGSFDSGSGNDQFYGADFLIEKDIVVVTLEYRLGAVGFLNAGGSNVTANAGLKDQVLALKWVKDNIVNFGGCPNRVTILGHNAGAASVQYHMLSPMSRGLFRSAIMQSGSFGCPWAISLTPKEDAILLGKKLGIEVKDTGKLVEKLKDISTKEIVKATIELMPNKNIFGGEMNIFAPSVETDAGEDAFLSNDPWEILKYEDITDVPVIIGVTAQEAGIFTDRLLSMAHEFESNFSLFVPKTLNTIEGNDAGDAIKKFYFNGQWKSVNQKTEIEFTNLLSDVLFTHGPLLSAKIMSSRMASPVYEYLFSYNSSFGFMKAIFKSPNSGAVHGDELAYQFYSSVYKNKPESGSQIEKKTNEILELWANFVKEGDPSVTMDIVNVKWEPMGNEGNYLDIDENLSMKKSIFKERMNFWAQLYKNTLGDYANL